jgi:hypothetical protein
MLAFRVLGIKLLNSKKVLLRTRARIARWKQVSQKSEQQDKIKFWKFGDTSMGYQL